VAECAVGERADKTGTSEYAVHEPEIGSASVGLLCEHGQHDRERRVEEVREQDREHNCPDQAVTPDEPHPFSQVREEAPGRLRVDRVLRPRNGSGDDRGGNDEARRVQPEGRGRAEPCDEHAPKRPPDEHRALLDGGADPARTLHPHARQLDDIREERLPRRRSGRVEERTEEHEGHELPELDPDGGVEQGDRGDRAGACEVGDDARRSEAQAVDDHAAEERGQHRRKEVEEDREGGVRGASRRDEHEPRDRELRHRVADERDRVGEVEGVEGTTSHAGVRLCRH
jgi:hypothetical protein